MCEVSAAAAPLFAPRPSTLSMANASVIQIIDLNLHKTERMLLDEALRRTEGTLCGAAELLGISRHAVKRRIHKHQIDIMSYKTGVQDGSTATAGRQ